MPGKQEGESKSVISRQNCIEEQSNDKELLDLFKIALTPVEAKKVSVGYLIKGKVLMRKWSLHVTIALLLLLLKEKWLDERISVLKYVAAFKDRLFRAGQKAKRNLQESKSKMKVWYDRKTKSRCFEPGNRVLGLFPVVSNPLLAKYSGPYKEVKKISDTNYLIRSPGRRKETQVCHIIMLKAYHDKPKPELVTLINKLGLSLAPTRRFFLASGLCLSLPNISCVGLRQVKQRNELSHLAFLMRSTVSLLLKHKQVYALLSSVV